MEARARRRQGFTLIELLIVVAIIGILAAIAIPNLMRRAAALEADLAGGDTYGRAVDGDTVKVQGSGV